MENKFYRITFFLILFCLLFKINNSQKNDLVDINLTNVETNDSESNLKNDNQTKNNETEYNVLDDYTVENDNIEILLYQSNIDRNIMTSVYHGFIDLKNEFYYSKFGQFNFKYMPENENYIEAINSLSFYWFLASGFVGIFFFIYLILRTFFGKFRGAKDENLHAEDRYLPWTLFCKITKF